LEAKQDYVKRSYVTLPAQNVSLSELL
jgi:hypothetical protein